MTATTPDTPNAAPATPARWSDLRRRLVTIAIGAPLVLLIVWIGTPLVEVTLALVATLVLIELVHMIDPTSRRDGPPAIFALWLVMYGANQNEPLLFAAAALVVLLTGLVQTVRRRLSLRQAMPHYAALLFGVMYTGLAFGWLMSIREAAGGHAWIIYLLFITWATDSFALLGGRWWGRRKLAPKISPAKTVEGALTGYVMGAFMGLVVALAAQLPAGVALAGMGLLPLFVIGGDLLESWLKRYYEVKDSGSLLPGHGGFFDRVDGLMLAVPVLYGLLRVGGIL